MALSSSRHSPQPTLRQPIPAAGQMQLGFCHASLHWLSWGAQPPTLAISFSMSCLQLPISPSL